jgi:hypothetical protein
MFVFNQDIRNEFGYLVSANHQGAPQGIELGPSVVKNPERGEKDNQYQGDKIRPLGDSLHTLGIF